MTIKRDRKLRETWIGQETSIELLLSRAGMSDCNTTTTPCAQGVTLQKKKAEEPVVEAHQYRSIVALANYIACWTRPDITFIVNKLCKYMSEPNGIHWQVLKHLLRYLKATTKVGLHYKFADDTTSLHGFSDSSFADCIDTGRSTLAVYGSAIISWYSKHNTYVTTSTNHSEYAALAVAAKEGEWLLALTEHLEPVAGPLPIYVDNSGIVAMTLNPVDHQANKNIRVTCHYVRELVANKVIIPIRVPTEDNIADILTAAVHQVCESPSSTKHKHSDYHDANKSETQFVFRKIPDGGKSSKNLSC